jgi:hypothetical protein
MTRIPVHHRAAFISAGDRDPPLCPSLARGRAQRKVLTRLARCGKNAEVSCVFSTKKLPHPALSPLHMEDTANTVCHM